MSIEKLKGRENFATWKFAMEHYLRLEGLWETIDGTDVKPEQISKAKSRIILMIDPMNFVHVQDAVTAKDVWDKLCGTFEDTGLTRRVSLLRILTTTNLHSCGSVESYVNTIISTAHKLKSIGMAVSDEWIGTLLLAGLPEEYKPMIMGIESSGVLITADSIKTKLLQDVRDDFAAAVNESDVALYSGQKNRKNKKNNQNSKSKGPRCFECNLYGHISKHCPSKSKQKPNVLFASYSAREKNLDLWYVDSGASSHMTMRSDWLDDFVQVDESVTVADNTALKVEGRGNAVMKVNVNNNVSEVVIKNILYVPNICANLLSVGQMICNGKSVTFNNTRCEIRNEVKQLIATASLFDNVYVLDTPRHIFKNRCSPEVNMMANMNSESFDLWHKRLGHTNSTNMMMIKNGIVAGVDFNANVDKFCETCVKGKHSRLPFRSSDTKTSALLELVHSDLCGPIEVESLGGSKYFLTFLDDFSRKVFVYMLKKKSEVAAKFVEFKQLVENQTGSRIRILRSDNGKEYCNNELSTILKKSGIQHQLTATYSPQQNGKAERLNRSLVEKATCLLIDSNLEKCFWAEAISTASYLINRTPCKGLTRTTPEEVWTKTKPNLSHLRTFGCMAMIQIPKQKRRKFSPKSKKCVFIGYCENTKAYRFYDQIQKKVVVSRDIVFIENEFSPEVNSNKKDNDFFIIFPVAYYEQANEKPNQDSSETVVDVTNVNIPDPNVMSDVDRLCDDNLSFDNADCQSRSDEDVQNSDDDEYVPANNESQTSSSEMDSVLDDNVYNIENAGVRKSTRQPKPVVRDDFVSYIAKIDSDPISYQDAISGTDANNWKFAILEEYNSLIKNNTWIEADLPDNVKPLNCMWVFKRKRNAHGEVVRYKARLVAKGCHQKKGVDYNETYSPVIRHTSIRYLLSIAVKYDLDIDHMDAITAFLQGELFEDIYIKKPEGFRCDEKVLKLQKSIYGLKQSSRLWNIKLKGVLLKFGLKQSQIDPCIFYYLKDTKKLYIAVYVDDLLIFSNDNLLKTKLKSCLKNNFEMKDLGAANSFLGLRISRDRESGKLYIDQEQYIQDLLNRFGMTNCNPCKTPMDHTVKLSKTMSPKTQEDRANMENVPYQELVGSLLFAAQVSRPDICYAVNLISRFNKDPGRAHWLAAKRILRFLKGTISTKLCYSKNEVEDIFGFCDADYASDVDERKSVTGYIFKKQGGAIAWCSKKQPTVALSTTESEYMALGSAIQEALWLKGLEAELLRSTKSNILYCDNQSAALLAASESHHPRTKHIDVRHHFVRDVINDGRIILQHISTNEMVADILTKALPTQKMSFCIKSMGLAVVPEK